MEMWQTNIRFYLVMLFHTVGKRAHVGELHAHVGAFNFNMQIKNEQYKIFPHSNLD